MKCGQPTKTGGTCQRTVRAGEQTCPDHPRAPSVPTRKLTPQVAAGIIEALASGVYRKDAALYNGIGTSTFYRWLETGEADVEAGVDSPQAELWEGVLQAEARAKLRLSAQIAKAGAEDWRAAAWLLERKHPDEYGRRDRMEITRPPSRTLDMTVLSDDDLDELERIVDLAGGAADG